MRQKNLLFVFADQWRASALGFAKSDPVITPNMDSFCEESVYCDHAYSTFPLCTPHRASLLTGKYPLSTGMFTNCKTGLDMRLQDHEIGLGQVLKEHGFKTAYIGKWHLDEPEQNHEAAPASGARAWDAYTPPGVRRHGFDFWYSYGAWDAHMEPHYWKDDPEMIQVQTWSPEHETDVAIEYIRDHKDDPFALCLSWNPPHSPYAEVPEKYREQYQDITLRPNVSVEGLHHHTGEPVPCAQEELLETTKQYYAAITGLDDQFGRLVSELKRLGIYEDTLIVLSSDHGDMMGSQGLMGKHVWYEESIHIPFVVRYPGCKPGICRTCIGSQDMMPTLLGMLDLEIPDSVEGEDCSQAILSGEDMPDNVRPAGHPDNSCPTGGRTSCDKVCYLCACPGRDIFLKEFGQAGKNPMNAGWRGVRTDRYTYVMDTGYGLEPIHERHLYDNLADRYQQNELDLQIAENMELADSLQTVVMNWMEEYKDKFRY